MAIYWLPIGLPVMIFDNRVRLELTHEKQTRVIDQREVRILSADRLVVYFKLSVLPAWHHGIIDTGAALTVFPEYVWRPLESTIEWIVAPEGRKLPEWLCSVSGLSGGRFSCRVGVIEVTFFDSAMRILRPRRIVVKCAEDAGVIRVPLIGLGGSVLEGTRLTVEYSVAEAWLQEVDDV